MIWATKVLTLKVVVDFLPKVDEAAEVSTHKINTNNSRWDILLLLDSPSETNRMLDVVVCLLHSKDRDDR
jgi:hypothetical protein